MIARVERRSGHVGVPTWFVRPWARMDALEVWQIKVAQRAGVSFGHLSQIMNGSRNPPPGMLKKLHGVLFQGTATERVLPAEVKVPGWRKGRVAPSVSDHEARCRLARYLFLRRCPAGVRCLPRDHNGDECSILPVQGHLVPVVLQAFLADSVLGANKVPGAKVVTAEGERDISQT